MRWEYQVFNFSEIDKRIKNGERGINLVTLLNEYGMQGWEVVFRLTENSFLMKRAF